MQVRNALCTITTCLYKVSKRTPYVSYSFRRSAFRSRPSPQPRGSRQVADGLLERGIGWGDALLCAGAEAKLPWQGSVKEWEKKCAAGAL